MTRRLSLLIARASAALLVAVPLGALYYLVNLASFAQMARHSLALPIQWSGVEPWQWYSLWALTALYLSLGLAGLVFLRRAFLSFASGDLFNLANSRDLKRFALLLIAQAIAKPVHHSLASVLLSMNHEPGQKMLSISLGSAELRFIATAIILWVLSSLLVEGNRLQTENRQFV